MAVDLGSATLTLKVDAGAAMRALDQVEGGVKDVGKALTSSGQDAAKFTRNWDQATASFRRNQAELLTQTRRTTTATQEQASATGLLSSGWAKAGLAVAAAYGAYRTIAPLIDALAERSPEVAAGQRELGAAVNEAAAAWAELAEGPAVLLLNVLTGLATVSVDVAGGFLRMAEGARTAADRFGDLLDVGGDFFELATGWIPSSNEWSESLRENADGFAEQAEATDSATDALRRLEEQQGRTFGGFTEAGGRSMATMMAEYDRAIRERRSALAAEIGFRGARGGEAISMPVVPDFQFDTGGFAAKFAAAGSAAADAFYRGLQFEGTPADLLGDAVLAQLDKNIARLGERVQQGLGDALAGEGWGDATNQAALDFSVGLRENVARAVEDAELEAAGETAMAKLAEGMGVDPGRWQEILGNIPAALQGIDWSPLQTGQETLTTAFDTLDQSISKVSEAHISPEVSSGSIDSATIRTTVLGTTLSIVGGMSVAPSVSTASIEYAISRVLALIALIHAANAAAASAGGGGGGGGGAPPPDNRGTPYRPPTGPGNPLRPPPGAGANPYGGAYRHQRPDDIRRLGPAIERVAERYVRRSVRRIPGRM